MQDQTQTIIGIKKTAKCLLYVTLAIIGLLIGYFFHQLAKWALSLPWIPLEGPLRLVASFHGSPVKFITALLGLIAGIWFAHSIIKLLLTVHITDDSVELLKGKHVQTINSEDIALVFIDHKRLVLLGTDGYELAREEIDEKPKIIEQAFKKHYYIWSAEGDPFKDKFRRWVPESPDLSPSAHAILKARQKALKKEETDDIEDFRLELAKIGIVVREEGTRQYWREAETYPPQENQPSGNIGS